MEHFASHKTINDQCKPASHHEYLQVIFKVQWMCTFSHTRGTRFHSTLKVSCVFDSSWITRGSPFWGGESTSQLGYCDFYDPCRCSHGRFNELMRLLVKMSFECWKLKKWNQSAQLGHYVFASRWRPRNYTKFVAWMWNIIITQNLNIFPKM